MERISTGNVELDRILCGGLPANTIHIIMGGPGSGKTLLAEQLAFQTATRARPALYLTTFSEPLAKFLTFLQQYTFADASRVGTDVLYQSLGETLIDDPVQLTDQIADLLQQHRPGLVVIDSFKAIADLMPDAATWRRQLYELGGLLSAWRATALWVGEYTSEMVPQLPEFAVVDGAIELIREQHGSRDFRYLRVVKLRGSGFLDGLHAVRLTGGGLKVYPRLVTPTVEPQYHPIDQRLGSGIPGLDAMIDDGWLRGTTTLVRGPSGSGKTILSLQFLLEGVRTGEPGLLVNFEESPVQIARVMRHIGWDPASLCGPGKLDVFFTSPVELQIDTIIGELFERVESQGVRRVVIDGIGDLVLTADDPVRVRDYLFALAQQLAVRNITCLLTLQASHAPFERDVPEIAYLADNVLLLEMVLGEDLTRTVRVLKSRASGHDGRRHQLTIGQGGVVVR